MLKKLRVVFVFSGSGTRFPVFIGAVRRIEEHYRSLGYELEIVLVVGTSGGAVLASGVASGYDTSEKLEKMCRDLMPQISEVLEPSLTSFIWRFGFFKTDKLVELFDSVYVKKMSDAKTPVRVVTVDVDAQGNDAASKIYSSDKTPEISMTQATLASMSIPFVFPHVEINGRKHVDGGWLKNFAVDEVDGEKIIGFYFGDGIVSLKVIPKWRLVTRLLNYIQRMVDISIAQNIRESIEDIKGMKNVDLYKLRTSASGLDFKISQEEISKMIQDGYDSVDRQLKTI